MRAGVFSSAFLFLMIAGGVAGSTAPASAQSYRPAFHPDAWKAKADPTPNMVLVLGTPHLSTLPTSFNPTMLTPLVDHLEAWKPTAIATEDLSGLQCAFLRSYRFRYGSTIDDYCFDPAPAQRATGFTVAAANEEVEKLLAGWPTTPTASHRRHLAAVFLAAGERGSALVQWLRLAKSERRAGDGLSQELVDLLDRYQDRRNETGLVAAVLATRLGLERLWSIDDHTADTPDSPDPTERKAYGDALASAWNNAATHRREAESHRLEGRLGQPDGLMNVYRNANAPDQGLLIFQSDFGAALQDRSPQKFGRSYVGYWETRNLRMVSNIRDLLGQRPGTRLLTLVGASHKPYLEAYLNEMHDVRLVDAEIVLR
jgi:hypothetical protein